MIVLPLRPASLTHKNPLRHKIIHRVRPIGCKDWVVPEKIHTPPTDGILEILAGGGVEDSGNPGGRGG